MKNQYLKIMDQETTVQAWYLSSKSKQNKNQSLKNTANKIRRRGPEEAAEVNPTVYFTLVVSDSLLKTKKS